MRTFRLRGLRTDQQTDGQYLKDRQRQTQIVRHSAKTDGKVRTEKQRLKARKEMRESCYVYIRL